MAAADFEKILTLFEEARVEFVVIGGVAMVAHGSAQATFDLDLCYRRSQENVERLCLALAPYHPALRNAPKNLPFRFDGPTVKNGLNFTLSTDLGDLDLLGEVAGLGFYEGVVEFSQTGEVSGKQCRILSLEGLIRAKRAAGRPRDLAALPELEALKELREKLGEK
jgi:hypothetical protein